jgi:hypothetical protein
MISALFELLKNLIYPVLRQQLLLLLSALLQRHLPGLHLELA